MSDEQFNELEDPNSWDDESLEVHPPVQNPRAVVSVSFSREDLRTVSEYARARGLKVSTFIREAALERVQESGNSPSNSSVSISSGHGGYINQDFTSSAIVRVATDRSEPE